MDMTSNSKIKKRGSPLKNDVKYVECPTMKENSPQVVMLVGIGINN